MFYPHGYMMYGFGNSILSLIWWVISIVVIVAVIRFLFGGRHRHWRHMGGWKGMGGSWMSQSALDILKERYAKGEINKEEYEEKKKVLSEEEK